METSKVTEKAEVREKRRYTKPNVAWPTVFLFGLSILGTILSYLIGTGFLLPFGWRAGFIGSLFGYIASPCSMFITVPLGIICMAISSLCSYAQFTVAHDAIHGAVSKNRKVNNAIGFLAQMWLGPTGSWDAIRWNHLTHHAHTNDSEKDPDYWCSLEGPGGYYLTPFRWMTVDVSYLLMYLPHIVKQSWKRIASFVSYEIAMITCLYISVQMGFFLTLLQYWIIPSRIAMTFLAFAFDFLPHYPHEVTRKENKYKTTTYLSTSWYLRPFLSFLVFYQNYHIAHHLIPIVPFYEYRTVFYDMKDQLLTEHDMEVRHLLPELGTEDLSPSTRRKKTE